MQITREDLNPCTVQLAVVCSPEEVEAGYERALKQISKKIKLPGFRPGHAPKSILEKSIDPEDWDEKAAELIVQDGYKDILEKEKLEPEGTVRPSVEITALNRADKKAEFTVKVTLPPVVEIGEYKGLEVEAPSVVVTDEDVEYQLNELRKGRTTQQSVTDRGVQTGDVCVVNIKIVGQEGDGRNFMSIAGQTFPELDEALLDMGAEEMKQLTLKFPKTFQEKDWAGKSHEVQVTVNSISTMAPPELDDEFAKALKADSVDELKERIRTLLGQAKEEASREVITDRLLEALMNKSTVHVGDGMWEQLAERRIREVAKEQHEAGSSFQAYVEEQGMTPEQYVEAWREKSKMYVQRALLIREIFSKEEMKLSEQDLTRELLAMSREYGTDPATLLDALRKGNSLEEIHFRAISRRVSDFLIENADKKEPVGAKA